MTGDPVARLTAALGAGLEPSSDFDLNREAVPPGQRSLRGAAVLVALDPADGSILLTKRASHLSQHPGQIAFPGGKIDAEDAGPEAAALREAEEEVGLPRGHVQLLGRLPDHETVTGFAMTPVVGVITADFDPRPEPGEVDEIFRVPLAHLAAPGNFTVQSRRWRGQRRHYYAVPYGPYYIWGATARILRSLATGLSA